MVDIIRHEAVDIAIVGAGVSASIVAAKLSQSGKKVLMLESGPDRTMNKLVSSQIWARRNKWAGSHVANKGKNTVGNNFNAGWGTGGSGMHHYAVWLRMHAEDFHMRSLYGQGLDWPIGYDDLRPYYDRIQTEVGISGDADAEIWRPAGAPYPMPPLKQFAQARVINKGFKKLGMHTAPIPMAINSTAYKGRPPCLYDGWCDSGCPIGALGNPLATFMPQARKAGAMVRNQSMVTRVLINKKGDHATGIEYIDAEGKLHEQSAKIIILAAFTIQNARLLLVSANEKHPDGLANQSGQVGRYIMSHLSGRVSGLFDEPTDNYKGVTGGQLLNQDNYQKTSHPKGFGSYQWLIATAMKPNDLLGIAASRPEIFGKELHGFMNDAASHYGSMVGVIEDLPVATNHISLSSNKDKFNVPLAEVDYNIHPESLALHGHAMEQGKRIFRAASAREVWNGNIGPMHIMGGTIMGERSEASVSNQYGQCHEIPNLLITGSGLFPTSAAVNPTFTLSALTLRTCDYLIKEWSSLS